jgi:hypothetical protein
MQINQYAIANSIRLARTGFCGCFMITEGDTDARLYKQFIDQDSCRVVVGFSKDLALLTLEILEREGFGGVLAVIDADFSHLEIDYPASQNVVVTDDHDAEIMMIKSPALERVIDEHGSSDKIDRLLRDTAIDVRQLLLSKSLAIGYWRWLSVRESLGIKFEDIQYQRVIDRATLNFRDDRLLEIMRSKSNLPRAEWDAVYERLSRLKAIEADPWQVVCGHDVTAALAIGLERVLGSLGSGVVSGPSLERELRLSYQESYFRETRLYQELRDWESRNPPYRLFRSSM